MKKTFTTAFLLFTTCFLLLAQDDGNDLYSLKKVHEIRINFSQKNWTNTLDSLRLYGNGMLTANAKIDGQNYNNVGIRYREVRSFKVGQKRNPLHIKLNFQKENQTHQGYQTIKLSNALRDPSMVREVMSYEMIGQYMIAPRASYSRVYINDNYYGLFVNVEAVDQVFLDKNFGSSSNTFVKCTPDLNNKAKGNCKQNIFSSLEFETDMACYQSNYELKSEEGWNDLIKLTETLKKKPAKIHELLDVDQTLWMLAFNNVIVNLSSYSGQYSQNFYLYKNDKGRFVPVVWDMNLAFGSFKNTGQGSDLDNKDLIRLDPLLHANNPYKPLIFQLLKNPDYKKTYLAHIRTILFDNFMNNDYEKRGKTLQQIIRPWVANDRNRSYTVAEFDRSLYSTIGKRSRIPGIYSLMSKRAKYLKKHQNLAGIPPMIEMVTMLGREQYSNEAITDFNLQVKTKNKAKRVKVFYRFDMKSDFQMTYLQDDGKNNDGKSNDAIFGGTIESSGNDSIEYYIVAENAISIGYFPMNYMFDLENASLKDLNK